MPDRPPDIVRPKRSVEDAEPIAHNSFAFISCVGSESGFGVRKRQIGEVVYVIARLLNRTARRYAGFHVFYREGRMPERAFRVTEVRQRRGFEDRECDLSRRRQRRLR